jgi:cytochrome c2
MRLPTLLIAAILGSFPFWPAAAQTDTARGGLSDLMVAMQFQHTKLWFAGKLGNWNLAAYELAQIEAGLKQAAKASSGEAASDRAGQVRAVRAAIDARDGAGFVKAYGELTNGCNACHRAERHGFITIQTPATSPFTDQLFVDQAAEGRGLAHMICAACHVTSASPNEAPVSRFPAPSFIEVARRPSFSTDSLRQLLASNHRRVGPDQTMPNPRLADYQIEEIIAYFETLRPDRPR